MGEGLVFYALLDFKPVCTAFTLIFIDWHSSFPPTGLPDLAGLFDVSVDVSGFVVGGNEPDAQLKPDELKTVFSTAAR